MALIGYTITVVAKQDNPYNVLPETDISIRKNSDNTLVNIYADEAGLIPIAQLGAKTDSNGQFTFYADASLGVLKAVWTSGGVIATEVLDQSDHSRLVNRNAVGAHDAIYRRETTVAEISAGDFEVGNKLVITDRNNAKAVVVSGTANGHDKVNSQGGKVAQIEISEPNTVYASQLGLLADTVYTTYVNGDLAAFVEENDISRIMLDTGDIIVNGTLAFVYSKVTFGGEFKLLSDNIDNMLQRHKAERSELKHYLGKFNTGVLNNQTIKSAIRRRELRVVLLGDSISVSPDYDSANIVASGYINTTGVDNIDKQDCLGSQLFAELVKALPTNVRVRFYSRSVGGLAYSSLDQAWDSIGALWSGREQVSAGKTWRDCVLDLNPDLVIHSMGMNESPTTYVDNYINKWDGYLITKQKKHCFDQVIMTTPNPNFWDAQQFGDFRVYNLNASKFYVAHLQRYMARHTDCSLIDVALNSNIKRYGFDPRNCTFDAKESVLTFADGSTSKIVGAGSSVANTNFTPSYLPIYHSTVFVIRPTVATNTSGYDFKFNAGSVIVQFNAGNISLFNGIYPSSLGAPSTTYAMTLDANADYQFTVTVMPHGTYVYFNDILILENTNAVYNATLPLHFENSGSSFDTTIKLGNVRGATFPQYAVDTASNGEMYGNLTFTTNKYGGGINHPSTVGLSEIYLPPCIEFFSDMNRSHTEYNNIVGGTSAGEAVFIGRIENVQYNRVTLKDYGSGVNLTLTIGAGSTYTVVSNPAAGGISLYLDTADMSLFLKNPAEPVLQFEYGGQWASKRFRKLGVTTPRGTLLPTVV